MGAAERIAGDLGARAAAGIRGTLLTFERAGHWHTLTVREAPHLELSLPAPALVGLELRLQLGEPTLRGGCDGEHVVDPRWRLRTNNLDRATLLLDEPPWPHRDLRAPPSSDLRGLTIAGLVGLIVIVPPIGLPLAAFLAARDRGRGELGSPRYVLTVEEGLATVESRSSDDAPDLAIGMARRLVQLVTRPARREAEIAHVSYRNHERNGPYR